MKAYAKLIAGVATAGLIAAVVFLARPAESDNHPQPDEIRSVEVRNDCPRSVSIWFGPLLPLRIDEALSLAPGMSTVQPLFEGDIVRLLDAAIEPLSTATVGAATRQIAVDRSCTQLQTSDSL